MSERDKFEAQKQKLDNLCDEHKLTASLQLETYPVKMTLRPLQGMYEQISMLESAEAGEDRISQDAYMTFYSRDGDYGTKTFGTFTMSETLQNKFKNIFKKLDVLWKHYFFRECIETEAIRRGLMPVIDEEEETNEETGEEPEEEGEEPVATDEDLITRATEIVRQENKCTTSLLQRALKLGYSSAAHLVDLLEQRGVVGPYRGSEPREVLPYAVPDGAEG